MSALKTKVVKEEPKPPIDWEELRQDYEGESLTLDAIYEKHNITPRIVSRHARERDWRLRRPRLTGTAKLKALVDRHIARLEQDFGDGETSEAQLNRLASLGRTLENISRLEKAASGPGSTDAGGAPITDERRRELARRLAALCGASGPAGPAEGAA
ncbi:MAG: hypothetical protein AB7F76_13825 [Parvibaculaceae bacterium]